MRAQNFDKDTKFMEITANLSAIMFVKNEKNISALMVCCIIDGCFLFLY